MIIGDDLDSLLSATFLHHIFGWPIKGVYCQYARLYFVENEAVFRSKMEAGRYFAVDLDIYHPAVPSLGHHIIEISDQDDLPGHTHTLNANAIHGLSVNQNYTQKYPLSTIHFLLWLFEVQQLTTQALALIWLSDSSYINAQRYRPNVENWVRKRVAHPDFLASLEHLQTPLFEAYLRDNVLQSLGQNPLARPSKSAYRSVHLGLNGFQCQFSNPKQHSAALQDLLGRLQTITGWNAPVFPQQFAGFWTGVRRETTIASIVESGIGLGEWLERESVFSYAITFKNAMNYTSLTRK
jgi:hypothetical protein